VGKLVGASITGRREVDMTSCNAYKKLKDLERLGLVTITVTENKKFASYTEKGKKLAEELRHLCEFLRTLSEDAQ
jgi:DNA-binding PadR family transcriptional regulator